jgi:FkbM family methyltransferase
MTDEHAAALRNHIEDAASALRVQLDTVRAQIAAITTETPPLYLAAGLYVILRSRNGYDLIVPCEEEGLLTSLVHHGVDAIEPGVRSVITKRLHPGAIAIDGGANIGLHALTMAAAVGPKGSVICFEPLPHLAAVLERTLRLNGLAGHTKVERAAISDTVGQVVFHAAPHSPLSSLFKLPDSVSAHSLTVPTIALDSYIPSGGRVDFVKLDIEGAEPHAWRGMQRVLKENPRIEVIVEWSASHFARNGEDPSRFIREIRAAGFTPFVIENASPAGRLIPVDDESVVTLDAINLLLTPQKGTE